MFFGLFWLSSDSTYLELRFCLISSVKIFNRLKVNSQKLQNFENSEPIFWRYVELNRSVIMVNRVFWSLKLIPIVRTLLEDDAQDILKIFQNFEIFDFWRFLGPKISKNLQNSKIAIFDLKATSYVKTDGLNRSAIGFWF